MTLTHHLTAMRGRDPHEKHRAATPLELLFDLTFVIAFSQASSQAAHYFELGKTSTAVVGFAIGIFAVTWAWINFSWLASAYDTDDVFFRVATFVEMVGVIIMALGLPDFFHSLDAGHHIDNAVLIAGYVVMRIATIALWLRAAQGDPARRRVCLTYAVGIAIVQAGWIIVIFTNPPAWVALALMVVLAVAEMAVPVIAERRDGGTPWHAHHIAERYSLLVIITLGEVILGTVLAISAVVQDAGWSAEAILVAFGGTLLAFGMWWSYFLLPSARILHAHRERSFGWGYFHIVLFGAVAAVGAGLHVAANVLGHEAHEIDQTYALWTVAGPVLLFVASLFVLYALLVLRVDCAHVVMVVLSVAMVGASFAASAAGASLGTAIVILALAPLVIVVGFESLTHRHVARELDRLGA